MRPYVPKDEPEPTRTSRRDAAKLETLPPEDPEEVFARLRRKQLRRRAAIVAMSLSALMIGGAVLLDRGLVESPTGFETFDDVELPEVPDLGHTWVGKALDEAKQARDAETAPRGVIRPLEGRKETPPGTEAGPSDPKIAVQDDGDRPSAADNVGSSAQQASAAPTPTSPAAATRRAGQSPPAASRTAAAAAREHPTTTQAPVADAAGPSTGSASSGVASSAGADGAPRTAKPEVVTRSPAAGKPAAQAPGTPAGDPPLADAPGVIVISQTDGPAEDDDAFYEDTQPDDAPVDPEQFRPRRPWPVPKGPPPAGGRVGHFSLVTLPPAEVRFRDHPLGSTPLHSQQLPSGRQRLILIGPDGVRRVLILDIDADAHTEIQLPISRLMPEALMP